MRERVSTLVAVLALAALAGCAGPAAEPERDPSDRLPHQGGVLVEMATANSGTADPQINYTPTYWALFTASYDGLTAFTKTGPNPGAEVVGDLATEVPKPTDDGLRWTFTLRGGIRFSDGRPVTLADVKASFERIFKVHGPTASSFYLGIKGAQACLDHPDTCDLSEGITLDELASTVTFNLTEPDAEFPQRLALPHASILPADTPTSDVGTDVSRLRATGPYYWASYDPTGAVVLKRNPYFREWSALAQPTGYPDRIEQRFGLSPTDEVNAVVNAQADVMIDTIPPDRLNEVSVKYPAQLRLDQQGTVWYWALNTRIPPFNDVRARRAVNLAFDRTSAVLNFGGPGLAAPTCQVLPPSVPGYQRYCPWTANPAPDGRGEWTGPDLARARQLVAESGTAGAEVNVVPSNEPVQVAMGEYLQTVLTQLGYRATLKPLDAGLQFPFIQNSGNNVQAGLTQWIQDYLAPSDFLHVLLACSAFVPNSDSSPNIGGFCDPAIDREMDEALVLGNTDVAAADKLWADVDRRVTDQAPWIALFNPRSATIVSARLGNYTYSAQYGFLPGVAWVR